MHAVTLEDIKGVQAAPFQAKQATAVYAPSLLAAAVATLVIHIAVLAIGGPHMVLASNLIQLVFPMVAVGVSIHQRAMSVDAVERRCWTAIGAAFSIWSSAQLLYLFFMYLPAATILGIRLDDALWVLFGLPLLLAVHTTHDELDTVQWADRVQAIFFFVVLYLMVFLRQGRMTLNTAYLIQNAALLLCCMLRLPICTTARERRFFLRLTIFLLLYGLFETVGDLLYRRGWAPGSLVDLTWTIPVASFIILVQHDALVTREVREQASRLVIVVRRMRGLSISALTFLTMGVSALLAIHHPVPGGLCIAACFALFALRTSAREHAWDQAHGQLQETVLKDPLTGLANRIQLHANLSANLSAGATPALLFVDLDRFKNINDSLGHALGDRLLIEVAARLRKSSPRGSLVCRIGGDEFVVLAPVGEPKAAEMAGETILGALRLPYEIGEHVLRSSASIGIVLASTNDEVDDLMRTADHAMYRAKQLGKDRVQLFDAGMLAQVHNRWRLESDLRLTVERSEIEIAFQPILTLRGGAIDGFEALARWSHPSQGNIPPCDFIPLAEETGLILKLGAQVLEKACRQVASWNKEWETQYTVSVNVSPRQFAQADFVSQVLATLQRTGLPPRLLRLEITESVLLVHEETVREILSEARSHGIRISLDDFGTGYSSLSFLLNLPVDEVKVDRSFVSDMHRDPQRRELVRTVVQLGHSLGKRVVAEGVETEHELSALAAMGCECAQGWLIGRPLSAKAMETDLAAITARNARPESQPQHGTSPLQRRGELHAQWAAALLS